MRVFISWSGDRSKRVAALLKEWLAPVVQAVRPWMSDTDIDRGAIWFTEISGQLEHNTVGIVCLTQENKNKPWILFEAGALAKGVQSNRVCTFLIDLGPADLESPLGQFNHTLPTKDGMWHLIQTINKALGESAINETILNRAFDSQWTDFKRKFDEIVTTTATVEGIKARRPEEILEEVLLTVRGMDKRLRAIEQSSSSPVQSDSRVMSMVKGRRHFSFQRSRQDIRFEDYKSVLEMLPPHISESLERVSADPTIGFVTLYFRDEANAEAIQTVLTALSQAGWFMPRH